MKQIQKNYLGIDVSKSWFDCSLIVIKGQQKQPLVTERFDNNQLNPYHQFFENYQKPYFPDCVTIIDICMFAISYDEYLENGYNPTQAETAAAQDAAYQSGLAGMAGGACV